MKFLFASDSWKGGLTNERTGELLKKAASGCPSQCMGS